jgi:hypothetical protein
MNTSIEKSKVTGARFICIFHGNGDLLNDKDFYCLFEDLTYYHINNHITEERLAKNDLWIENGAVHYRFASGFTGMPITNTIENSEYAEYMFRVISDAMADIALFKEVDNV